MQAKEHEDREDEIEGYKVDIIHGGRRLLIAPDVLEEQVYAWKSREDRDIITKRTILGITIVLVEV